MELVGKRVYQVARVRENHIELVGFASRARYIGCEFTRKRVFLDSDFLNDGRITVKLVIKLTDCHLAGRCHTKRHAEKRA